MLNTPYYNRQTPSHGMTLIELLVVVFIMMLFVAAAAPLVNPNTVDRKIREASRQVNAYIAEAKAHAAQRNRPVGIAFDRATAVREGARDSNLVSRMFLVEVPPIYTGATIGETCRLTEVPNNGNAQDTAFVTSNTINGYQPRKFRINFFTSSGNPTTMLDYLIASYVKPGNHESVAISIRLNARASYLGGYVDCDNNGSTPSCTYYVWSLYGSSIYNWAANSGDLSYQIALPPMMTGDTPLELPTGSIVDLQFSGSATNGDQFFDNTRANASPTIVLFTPGGSVSAILQGNGFVNAPGKCHFLIGSSKVAIEARDMTPGNEANRNFTNSLLNDASSSWVSISSQTGHVSTSDNIIPTAAELGGSATNADRIRLARLSATSLNSKGGR
jgi:type II secretory pathway pseudopilin PulG